MIICFETELGAVVREVELAGALSYTFLPNVFGKGRGGGHRDSEANPGHNAAVLVGCDGETSAALQQRLRALKRRLKESGGLEVFAWEAEKWL
jgi:hypothetical protein